MGALGREIENFLENTFSLNHELATLIVVVFFVILLIYINYIQK